MKSILETQKTREMAAETQRLLAEGGIASQVIVDPLEARYPDLAHFRDVAVVVAEESLKAAVGLMDKRKRAKSA